MEILRDANASQFNLLHLAYRVPPRLAPGLSEGESAGLVVGRGGSYEELAIVPGHDELSVLLSFQLEQPLAEWLDPAELHDFVPTSNPLWQIPTATRRPGSDAAPRTPCLLTLIDPTPAEAEALESVNLLGLLDRFKSLAKQLRKRTDHSVPEALTQLPYTTVNVVAVRRGVDLHSIGREALAGNVRWFLARPWLDDRLRHLFVLGVDALAVAPGGASDAAPAG